jgi:GDSL-like lipase/acylhydrolase family protein
VKAEPIRGSIIEALAWTRIIAGYLLVFLVITAGSIWLALRVTPLQTVSAAGQTAQVGATLPSLSARGPGELDLFGQAMPTRPQFTGPIRPRLQLSRITINPQVVQTLRADGPRRIELSLSQELASGWERYFVWETLIAAGFAAVPLIAFAAVRRKPMLKIVAIGLAVACAVNVGGVLLTASGTPGVLRGVKTLDDLVGVAPLSAPQPAGKPLPGVQAVVIGDSTAAGAGLPAGRSPSALTRACGRSTAAYPADLGMANGWTVLNLACGGATIENGLLGAQVLGNGQVAPVQLAEAQQATHAKVIIVSVGADDVSWAIMTQLCAASTVCNDKVSTAYFTQLLDSFTRSYYQLLGDLADLPWHPAVLVNEYYSPFGTSIRCLARYGMTAAKEKVLLARLGQLNAVLARGATAFGYGVADPRFAGHELCTPNPYVQGPADRAPLHPNVAGQLAIALADQQALPGLLPSPVATPAPAPAPAATIGPEAG